MKKSIKNKILSLCMALVMSSAVLLGGCGGSSNKLQFWVYGDEDELSVFTLMTEEFNKTYGKEHNIEVEISAKPTGGNYTNLIQTTASSSSGADIFFVIENDFKKWVEMGFMQDMTEYFEMVDDIDISDIPDTMLNKYRYNEETETRTVSTDPIYGLPMEVRPTALYYNEDVFIKAGIVVISVDEENMVQWNNNEIPDNRGKYKRDFSKLDGITVPKKGYMYDEQNELRIFNNRIAMNWDEVEDLAKLFSKSTNPNAQKEYGTEYGYFTEWWFNYGWSVGGDCLADLTGTGYWNFSLLDPYENFLVNEDGYVGQYTGTLYKKGESLQLVDKLNVPKGTILEATDKGGYKVNGVTAEIREEVEEKANNGDFTRLPSIRTAFQRYLSLGVSQSTLVGDSSDGDDAIGGLAISPTPSIFSGSGRSSVNYFYSGKIAMLVEQSSYMKTIAKETKFKWDVAPIAVYKEYEDDTDPYNDTIKVQGKVAGHSNSRGLVSRKKATRKEDIARFIMWMSSKEGQMVRAQNGHFPNQESLLNQIKFGSYTPNNVAVFSEAMKYQTAGDWWYLKNYTWIDVWAVPVNTKFRNGTPNYSYKDWVKEAVNDTNEMLYNDYIRRELKK